MSDARTDQADSTVAAIMAEQQEWLRILEAPGEATLKVFLDLKSPHGHLAIRPTLESRGISVSRLISTCIR